MANEHGGSAANLIRWLTVWVSWVAVVSFNASATTNAIELQSGYDRYTLNAYASYLVDNKGSLDVRSVTAADGWQLNVSGGVLNFGFTHATVWVKTSLNLPLSDSDAWHLVIPYPLLEHVELFLKTPATSEYVALQSTDSQVRSHYLHFPIANADGGQIDLLMRVRSLTSLQVPLELWSQSYFAERENVETLIWGIYFGVLLALMAYNGFLFLSMWDSTYLYYVLYLGAFLLLMQCMSGYGVMYLWGQQAQVRYILPAATGMCTLWGICFALAFLRGCGIHPWLVLALKVDAVLSLVLVFSAFSGSSAGAMAAGLMSLLSVALVILAGLNALASGIAIARYFTLAWTAFTLGAMAYILNIFNLVPVSSFTNHAIQVGSALEAVLLSFALAHRIKEERRQKLSALEQKSIAEKQVKQAQSLALEQALHDSLTQRPNDALLMRRVQELIRDHDEVDAFALLVFYCPQLKDVSSSLGRRLAEEAFCAVVEDLNRLMGNGDQNILIEPGSDSYVAVTEFGSIVTLCRLESGSDSLKAYAQSYLAFYDRSIEIDGVHINLGIVCGIASYPKHGDRADLLLQHAFAARDFGLRMSDNITLYSSEIESFGRRRLMLIGGLTQAIRDSELELYLQPQVESDTLRLVGAEVLLRWNSPRFGPVSPKEFIEVAEQAGLMGSLTRYVIERAFVLLAGLRRTGLEITLSINLSIQNLVENGIVHFMTTTAAAAGISLSDVVLEVTETSVSENMDKVIDNLQQLAATGCCIALDDYGTGYSSLAYLSRLPIHELKIDRTFIAQMHHSNSDMRIVENTVKLARALQIQTVAEGVEDETTLAHIMRLGCDRVQGFLLAKPMPLTQFREWVFRRSGQLLENSASH